MGTHESARATVQTEFSKHTQNPLKMAVKSRETFRGSKLFFARRDFSLDRFRVLWHM
jgi:hypothetical protein